MTEDKQIELRECPFCGSKARHKRFIVDLGHGDFEHQFWAECLNQACRSSMRKSHQTPMEAAEQWNHRSTDTRIEKLDAALEAIATDTIYGLSECRGDIHAIAKADGETK